MSLTDCKVCDQGYVFVGTHSEGHDGGDKEYNWKDVYEYIINLFPDNENVNTLYDYKIEGYADNFIVNRDPVDGGGDPLIFVQDGMYRLGHLYNDGNFRDGQIDALPTDPNVWMTLTKNGKDHSGATSKYIS